MTRYPDRLYAPVGIVIHHTAFDTQPDGTPVTVEWLDALHARREFAITVRRRTYHVGYHYVVLADGSIGEGRPEESPGAHTLHVNNTIGIALVGDFDRRDGPGPSDRQLRSLTVLIRTLLDKYSLTPAQVLFHRDLSSGTVCPGRHFQRQQLYRLFDSQGPLDRPIMARTPDQGGLE
jgi:N-acetyl-anhydromuramyl-L-alanine amidase AmpD